MNQKETMTKHAVKKVMAALHILLLSVFLLGSRSTLMMVQAENEMNMPSEDIVGEAQEQPQSESEELAQAEDAEEAVQAQEESIVEEMTVTMVGDSIMLGAASSIQERLPECVIDAKVSRQVFQADDVITSLEGQNALGQIVVIGLGTNGPFDTTTGQELIDRLGSGRTIYWVTVYGTDLSWQEDSNATIRALAENNENVHLIDWAQAASEHPEWICKDGIHLSAAGRSGYAGIVLENLL